MLDTNRGSVGSRSPPAVEVIRYTPEFKKTWDDFVSGSKNGIFLFLRDYMDYHSDRFPDHSLMFFDGARTLIGVMPAHVEGTTMTTHGGLTFGGIVAGYSMTATTMLSLFSSMRSYLVSNGIEKLVYKAIPHIYHIIPSEDDLFALSSGGARLAKRDVSSAILMPYIDQTEETRLRKRMLKKAASASITVERSYDFDGFMELVSGVLRSRHGASPVHTVKEIRRLASIFPDNIKLFTASGPGQKLLAGLLVYEHKLVAHAQYNANSDEGRLVGANEAIYDYVIHHVYRDKRYFDFGTSMENNGPSLNPGLLRYKESFGARTVVYDCYELDLADSD